MQNQYGVNGVVILPMDERASGAAAMPGVHPAAEQEKCWSYLPGPPRSHGHPILPNILSIQGQTEAIAWAAPAAGPALFQVQTILLH